MKAGLLLRIGIHLLGVWALYTALTTGIQQLHLLISVAGLDVRTWFADGSYIGGVYAYFVFSLLFAFCAFVFAGRIQRKLLGAESDAPIAAGTFAPTGLLAIGCRILGLYLIASYGAYMVATLYEMVTIRAGGGQFSEGQVTSDAIANFVGLTAGVTLARKTEWVLRWCGIVAGAADTKTQP